MVTIKNSSFYHKKGDYNTVVYVLARGNDLRNVSQVTFTEVGSGRNIVLPEYLFEKNYESHANFSLEG